LLGSALSKLARAGVFALVLVIVNQSHSALSAAVSDNIAPFTAKGTVLMEVFQKAGGTNASLRLKIENEVFFAYSNGWWRLELEYKSGNLQTNAAVPKGVPSEQLSGNLVDCKNIPDGVRYVITRRNAPDSIGVTNILKTACLEPTKFPPPEMPDLFVCWLALCPNPELPVIDGSKMRRLISSGFLKDSENRGEYGLKYIAPDNAFLLELCITNDGMVPMHDGSLMKQPAPYDKGYREFEYQVLETTNWNGAVFPLRSVLHKYVPLPNGSSREDLFSAVVVRLNVESIQAGFERPEVDLTKSMFMAKDNRLPHLPGRQPIRYAATNDQWVAATNPALVRLAAAYNSAPNGSVVDLTAKRRHVMVVVMGALTLAPLAILIRFRTTKKNNTK
jgi:hypothetical protein